MGLDVDWDGDTSRAGRRARRARGGVGGSEHSIDVRDALRPPHVEADRSPRLSDWGLASSVLCASELERALIQGSAKHTRRYIHSER